jgi:hypothetical protein
MAFSVTSRYSHQCCPSAGTPAIGCQRPTAGAWPRPVPKGTHRPFVRHQVLPETRRQRHRPGSDRSRARAVVCRAISPRRHVRPHRQRCTRPRERAAVWRRNISSPILRISFSHFQLVELLANDVAEHHPGRILSFRVYERPYFCSRARRLMHLSRRMAHLDMPHDVSGSVDMYSAAR